MSTSYPFFQIDAFASKPFEGNQACVMPLEDWSMADATLQAIAAENNVAETAYVVPTGDGVWDLRWFTPATEVPLCGHATLAAAHALFTDLGFEGEEIAFDTRQSGRLTVKRADDGRLEMDFPAAQAGRVEDPAILDRVADALGAAPMEVWAGLYAGVVFAEADAIPALAPDLAKVADIAISEWEAGCIGCFAMGGPDGADVVSRFFAPGAGIPEDPATGSWHCMIAPVVAARGGPETLNCFQAYPGRGAWVETELAGDRVKLRGTAVTVIEGRFQL